MKVPSRTAWLIWRASIALVWLYQGLWHKVLSTDDSHRKMMAQALGNDVGPPACMALGLLETAVGIAVFTGFRPKMMAVFQIALLVGVNGAGLIFAAASIPDPAGMIVMNAAFGASIWMHATLRDRRMP